MPENSYPLKDKFIGLSISEPDQSDLAAGGYGVEHLHVAMVQIAGKLLRLGANLVHGGDLRLGGFTRTLFDIARSEHQAQGASENWNRRLTNYMSFPYYQKLSKDEEARLLNICRFIRITPEDAGFSEDAAKKAADDPVFREYLTARCLSRMRSVMQEGKGDFLDHDGRTIDLPPLFARIIMGGKLDGYSGFMPGIAEETLYALEDGTTALYILGDFGGAAGAVAESLAHNGETHEKLTWESRKETISRWREFIDEEQENHRPEELFSRIETCFSDVRQNGDLGAALKNGLSHEENTELIFSSDLKSTIYLLEKGLTHRAVGNG